MEWGPAGLAVHLLAPQAQALSFHRGHSSRPWDPDPSQKRGVGGRSQAVVVGEDSGLTPSPGCCCLGPSQTPPLSPLVRGLRMLPSSPDSSPMDHLLLGCASVTSFT